ncbi:hypothetical protein ACLOJK_028717 [Asimina triloba]
MTSPLRSAVAGPHTFEAPSKEGIGESGQGGAEARTAKEQEFLVRCGTDLGKAKVPMRRGVLGSTFGEASSGIRECHALGLAPSLDKERRGVDEQILLEYLPNVWKELSELEERLHLINGCTSREEYHYHVLRERSRLSVKHPYVQDQFGVSSIMDEDERWKVIAVGKRPEEVGVEQVSREVLRPDVSIPSKWELLEEVLVKVAT